MSYSEEYLKYLESKHWKDLRDEALDKANRNCEACPKRAGEGHHLVYRDPLESCTAADIMALYNSGADELHHGQKPNIR